MIPYRYKQWCSVYLAHLKITGVSSSIASFKRKVLLRCNFFPSLLWYRVKVFRAVLRDGKVNCGTMKMADWSRVQSEFSSDEKIKERWVSGWVMQMKLGFWQYRLVVHASSQNHSLRFISCPYLFLERTLNLLASRKSSCTISYYVSLWTLFKFCNLHIPLLNEEVEVSDLHCHHLLRV